MTTLAIAPATRRPPVSYATPLGVRLTGRGRAAVIGLFLLLALTVAVLRGAGASQAAAHVGAAPATQIVVVQPGESLWSIAERVAPSADPRETIARIVSLNGLTSSVLPAAKALVVPAPAA